MRSGLTKRLTELEKRANGLSLSRQILKFTEADIERYIDVCKQFNDKFPGTLSFAHIESEDIQEIGRVWALNLTSVLSHAMIKQSFGDNEVMEWLNHGLPEICQESGGID